MTPGPNDDEENEEVQKQVCPIHDTDISHAICDACYWDIQKELHWKERDL